MSGAVFVAVLAGLPLLGWGLVPRRVSSWLPPPAGLAVAAGIGALAVGVEMLGMSALGIRWTVLRIAAVPLLLTGIRLLRDRRGARPGFARLRPGAIGAAAIIAGFLLV